MEGRRTPRRGDPGQHHRQATRVEPRFRGGPKNWIEVKAGRRVTIEGNLMTSGTPTNIAITVRNQNGSSPWIEITDLVFRNNKLVNFKDPGFGIQLKDNEKVTGQSGNLVIEDNLMTASSTDSRAFLTNGGHDVVFTHNTILNAWALGVGAGLPTQNLTLIDNILHHGKYGMGCDGGGACWPGLVIKNNLIVDNQGVGGLSSLYPAGNFFPSSDAAVGWVDPASDNYGLSASSPYKGKASDGTDPGVDMNGLLAALGGTASTPSPTPQPPAPTPTPAADTKPPTVAITSPSSGATVSKTVGVNVSANDNVGVTMTKYLVDGGIVGGFSPPSMNLSWDSATVSNSSHVISVVAYDAAGNSSQSTVQVNVANPTSSPSATPPPTSTPTPTPTPVGDTKPPTVAITSPSSGATVSKTVGVNVSASDNVGVTMTKYLVDGGIVGDFSPPSTNLSWDSTTVSNGSHMISVVAYDAAGNSSQSTVQVNVANRGWQGGTKSPKGSGVHHLEARYLQSLRQHRGQGHSLATSYDNRRALY